jgi:hypothetical protein
VSQHAAECLLSGVKRTWTIAPHMSALTQSGHRCGWQYSISSFGPWARRLPVPDLTLALFGNQYQRYLPT